MSRENTNVAKCILHYTTYTYGSRRILAVLNCRRAAELRKIYDYACILSKHTNSGVYCILSLVGCGHQEAGKDRAWRAHHYHHRIYDTVVIGGMDATMQRTSNAAATQYGVNTVVAPSVDCAKAGNGSSYRAPKRALGTSIYRTAAKCCCLFVCLFVYMFLLLYYILIVSFCVERTLRTSVKGAISLFGGGKPRIYTHTLKKDGSTQGNKNEELSQ